MILSINEIKSRAVEFSHEWKDETRERAEAQTFWNDFFNVFGITRKRVASFEKPALRIKGGQGFIDLFWKGKLIVEHKSKGHNLDKAYNQAKDYFNGLDEEELPKYVIVTDFKKIRLYDLEERTQKEFDISNLIDNIGLFDFISGHERIIFENEDPVNIKAAQLMGKLHDSLKYNGYIGHNLEILLVRLMFCLFADDTDIFEKNRFREFINRKTKIDGSDTGQNIINLFEVLNTSEENRQKNLDEELNRFPYIDGNLFEERIPFPSFDSKTRSILLECCHFDWSLVSPAVFGSLFQSVMNQEERHDLGGHYTSEKNILKTINPLFLYDLNNEFKSHKNNKRYLEGMLVKIGKIKLLDTACGCGNFLMIAYRELRRLQIKIHTQLRKLQGNAEQRVLNVVFDKDLNVDSMYGIEILEFPARIAQVGLWLIDHLVNRELSKEFGFYFKRLPLKKAAKITIGNALKLDWNKIIPKEELTYILGNPPFISKQDRNKEQQEDMDLICKDIKNYGLLDYVSCWYIKTAEYIKDSEIKVGLVSTNSITQGEQVGVLWKHLFSKGIKINFAHKTFRWSSDAKWKAHVHVVIIGFSMHDAKEKWIYEYPTIESDPVKIKAKNINPYLIDQKNIFILNRSKPICNVPEISFGNMPNDGGNFLFNDEEKEKFLKKEPSAKRYIKPLISAKEFLHNKTRWCLWLKNINPSELNHLKLIKERVFKVKEYRLKSKRKTTRELAQTPYLFGEIRQPLSDYIFIPLTSSENRYYIPMAFFSKENIVNNTCSVIPNATLYHFGVLMSTIHMAWVKQVCGRMKSDYRYSNNLVYNNFPWPENITDNQIKEIKNAAKSIITIRKRYNSSLSELYNPLSMPKDLLQAHKKLDRLVNKCYRNKPFKSDREIVEFLFELYDKYTSKNQKTIKNNQ
ncbi:class I SAM-dependent DNA methyltransferase [Patescibacteria group bacterium]|nr:class I SAM-dependent DNA methyltransferase [Patescibacteria group bacterium]